MAGRMRQRSMGALGNVLLAVALATFIFTAAVVLVLNAKWLYYIDITLLRLERRSGMTVDAIRANYDALIRYNQFWSFGELTFPSLPMSQTARIHFQEVKRIFVTIQYLCMVSFVGSLVGIVKKWRSRQRGYLWIAGMLTLGTPLALGIAALVNWDGFFTAFHRIFFRNDYWLFDSATDPVILILPDTYFLHCALLILLCVLLGGLLCLFLARRGRSARPAPRGRGRR